MNSKTKYYSTGYSHISLFQHNLNIGERETSGNQIKTRKGDSENTEYNLKQSLYRTKGKIIDLALANKWKWFITFTLDPQKVDSFDYEQSCKVMRKWIDNIKQRKAPNIKYLIVAEKHPSSGRIHFHALFDEVGKLEFVHSGTVKVKGIKKPMKLKRAIKYGMKERQIIYNVGNYKNGWSTAVKIYDDFGAAKYISDYITEDLMFLGMNKQKYWRSNNLKMPLIYYGTYGIDGNRFKDGYLQKYSKYNHSMEIQTELFNTNMSRYLVDNRLLNIPDSLITAYELFGSIVKKKQYSYDGPLLKAPIKIEDDENEN